VALYAPRRTSVAVEARVVFGPVALCYALVKLQGLFGMMHKLTASLSSSALSSGDVVIVEQRILAGGEKVRRIFNQGPR
jgi:hypothetical protein